MALIHGWPLTENTDDCIDSSHIQTVTALPSNLKDEGVPKRAGKVSINTFDFNGSNTLIDTGVRESSLGNNFTISAWLLADTGPNYRDAIGRHNNGEIGGFFFGEFIDGNLRFAIVGKDSSGQDSYSAINTTLPLNTGTHFTMVVKDGNTVQLYKNGEFVASNSSLANHNLSGNPIGTILIGMSYSSSDHYWDGAIQDIRIYDEPLSPKEVKKLAQGLIIHYNPDHILGYNLFNHYDGYTANNPYTTNSPSADNGPALNVGCDIVNGKIYTLSADMDGTVVAVHGTNEGIDKKSCSIGLYFRVETGAEGAGTYKTPICYTRTSPHFRRISKTRYAGTFTAPTDTTIKSCTVRTNTYSDGTHPVLVHFWNFKLEEGEIATPFSLTRDGQALDSSGFWHDGTIVSEAIEKSTDHRYKKNIVADGNPEHYIQSNINPSFLTSGVTFNVWYKNITNKTFLIANGQSDSYYVSAISDINKGCYNVSGATYYIDGEPRIAADGYPKDGQGHMYTSVHTSVGSGTSLYWNKHNNEWAYNGPLGDIRLYATALSAADVKNLYNETRVTHPMQFLISNSSALASLTSSNPVLADGELVVVRSTDGGGKTCFNIRKGNGVSNFNSLPWKQISETLLKGGRSSFTSDGAALTADTNSYSQLGGGANR